MLEFLIVLKFAVLKYECCYWCFWPMYIVERCMCVVDVSWRRRYSTLMMPTPVFWTWIIFSVVFVVSVAWWFLSGKQKYLAKLE